MWHEDLIVLFNFLKMFTANLASLSSEYAQKHCKSSDKSLKPGRLN